jgi:flagellum-specific peptidoglycan hydrolase FlgJ
MKGEIMPSKKKRQSTRIIQLLVGFAFLVVAFGFALRTLSEPTTTTASQDEATTHKDFIAQLAPHAKELQTGYGVLPSITLGQAILESNWGKSELAKKYHNLFGIKAASNQKKVTLDTKEYSNEQWITIKGDFRVYDTWAESMDDHTQLFVNGTDWNAKQYADVLAATDYKTAAKALQSSGYATDPDYADKIINVIETYNLEQYDVT